MRISPLPICAIICVLWTFVLTGCIQVEPPSTPSHPALPEASTPNPNHDETVTATPVPASSLTPSLLLATPFPSLPSNERQNQILGLLSNNGGCNLPCWWGIAPGKTSWSETWRILSLFDPEPFVTDTFVNDYFSDSQIVNFLIPVSEEISTSHSIHITLRATNIVHTISIYPIEQVVDLYMPHLLTNYGMPSEVWIHAYRSYLGGIPPADMLLFYPEQGILARYSTNLTQINESQDIANICIDSAPSLDLWSPNKTIDFDKAQDIAWLDYKKYNKPLLPLEQASGITLEQFYDKRMNDKICIATKLSLWPEP